jgi:hypothetical protein
MQAVGMVNDHEIKCFRYKDYWKKFVYAHFIMILLYIVIIRIINIPLLGNGKILSSDLWRMQLYLEYSIIRVNILISYSRTHIWWIGVRVSPSAFYSWSHIFNKFKANNLVLEIEYIIIEISINYAKCCNIYIFI